MGKNCVNSQHVKSVNFRQLYGGTYDNVKNLKIFVDRVLSSVHAVTCLSNYGTRKKKKKKKKFIVHRKKTIQIVM